MASRLACLVIFIVTTASCLGRFLGQASLIFRGQNLAGDRGRGLHHQPADFAFELGQHAGVVLGGGLARLDHDLFGGGDGLLGFLLAARGRRRRGLPRSTWSP